MDFKAVGADLRVCPTPGGADLRVCPTPVGADLRACLAPGQPHRVALRFSDDPDLLAAIPERPALKITV